MIKLGAYDPVIFNGQAMAFAGELGLDVAIEAGFQEAPDQSLPKAPQIGTYPALHFCWLNDSRASAQRGFAQHQPMNVASVKDFLGPVAEFPEVEKLIVQGASTPRFGAGTIQIIVRIAVQDA